MSAPIETTEPTQITAPAEAASLPDGDERPLAQTPSSPGEGPSTGAGVCRNCGAAMAPGQDWCLQCGAGAPGSLQSSGPSWRSATTLLLATAVLVLGAAAAGYAALNKSSPAKPPTRVITVAQAPATGAGAATPGATIPPATPPAATTPSATPAGGSSAPGSVKQLGTSANPPKIPLTAPTPKTLAKTPAATKNTGSTGTGKGTGESSPGSSEGAGGAEPSRQPILLDTNAASTYNPYNYPESEFGDPRLAIDGEAGTGWTARVNPVVAPKMAEGIVIDLKSPQKVASVALTTSTPGMTVQVYGANGATPPSSITDPAWKGLSAARVVKKKTTNIKLHNIGRGFRFYVLWISKAPLSAVGTAQAPGHVSVNELELFPAK